MAFVVGDIEGRLLLDLEPFQAGLDQARADGAQFASQAFTATLDVDQTRLDAGLTNAAAKIGSLSSDIVLRLNQSILDAQLAAVVAKLEALGPKSVSVDLDTALFGTQLADVTAKLDALTRYTATPAVLLDDDLANAALDALQVKLTALGRQTETVRVKIDVAEAAAEAAAGSELGRMGGIGGMGGGLAGAGADVGLQELIYGSEPGGFLGKVLSPLTMLSTLFSAQFGSLGSLMGFGPEHLLTTLLGLGGLATGGAMGAGLLGLGSLGKTAIGGGSDSLVSHETLSNVEALITGTEKLTAVIKKVGVTAGLAEGQLATAWQKMTADFDKATGPAQAEVAGIGEQIVKLATDYIPLVAQAAKTNFGIIAAGLKPLFAWLEGSQGKGIFENLEKEFSGELPTTIHAVTQGLELFLRVMNLASTYTGGFTKHLDEWLTRMNGATFGKVSTEVGKLIGDFHLVDDFIKALGKDIVDIFKNDAGTATDVLKLLTHALQELGTWINSIAGKGQLQKLFTVHKGETLQLMHALGSVLVSFGKVYLSVAPYFVEFTTDLLKLANGFFEFTQKIPEVGKLVAIGVALFVMEEHAHTLTNAIKILRDIWNLPTTLMTGLQGAEVALGEAWTKVTGFTTDIYLNIAAMGEWGLAMIGVETESIALNALMGVGMVAAIAAVGFGIYELVTHWSTVVAFFERNKTVIISALAGIAGAMTVLDIVMDANPIGIVIEALAALGLAAYELVTHWDQVWKEIKAIVDGNAGEVVEIVLGIVTGGLLPLYQHWSTVWNGIESVTMDVVRWFEGIPGDFEHIAEDIIRWFEDLPAKFVQAGKDMIDGLKKGAEDAAGDVVHAVEHVGSDILHGITSFFGIFSPSKVMQGVGNTLMAGLTNGITSGGQLTVQAATKAAQAIVKAFGSLTKLQSEDKTLSTVSSLLDSLTSALTRLAKFGSKEMTINFSQLTVNFETLSSAISKLHPLLTRLETDLKGIGTKALDSVSSNLKSLDTVLGHISTAFKTMANVTKNVASVSIPEFIDAVKKLPGLLEQLMPILVTLRTSLAAMGGPTMKGVMDDLHKFGTVITDFGRILTELAKTAKTAAATTIPADFKLLQQAAKEISTGLTQTWTAIQGAASKKWAAIAQALSQVPGKLEAPFKGIKTTFITIGESLMAGLQSGITSGESGVVTAMTDAVTQAVAAAKKAGKISSPSMLAADEIGKPLMQGIVEGFRSEIPTANAVITNWANTVPLAFKSAGDKAAASLVFGVRQALTELEALKKTLGAVGTRLVDALANAVSEGSTTIVRVLAKVKAAIAKAMTLKDAATLAAAGFHATLSQSIQTALTNLSQAFAHAKSKIAPSLQKAVSEAIADLTAKSATLGAFAAELAANLAKALQSGNAAKIITAILNIGHATGATGTKGLKGNAGGPATTANAGPGYTAFTGNAGGPATTASANLKYYKTPTTGKWIAYHTTIPAAAAATAATAATVATTAAATAAARIVGITHTTPLKLVGGGTLGKGTPATAKLLGTVGTGLLGGTPLAGTPGVGSTGAGTTGATAGYYSTTAKAVAAYTSAITKANAAVKSLTTAVKLLGTGLSALTKLFTSVTKTITTSLKSGWTKIVSYLSTLPAQMKAIGTQLMAGLATGITAGTSSVVAAMVVAIDKAIAAAKAHAGIKSPSELAATQIGLPLAQGMAEGILRGSSVVGDAAKSALAEAFGPTFHPPSFGDYGGSSSAPVTHNGPLVSVGQIVLHGVDLSNAGAVQAAVRKGLDEYTDTMQQLLGQQGKT